MFNVVKINLFLAGGEIRAILTVKSTQQYHHFIEPFSWFSHQTTHCWDNIILPNNYPKKKTKQ